VGSVAQTIVEEKELRGGLAKPKVQPIPFESICLVLLARWIVRGLHNVLVGDLKCVLVVLERSPPHLFLYLFLFDKEKQK